MSHTKNSSIDDSIVALLESGCPNCEFDEAEGELVNHCAECQKAIVTDLYQLMVLEGYRLTGARSDDEVST